MPKLYLSSIANASTFTGPGAFPPSRPRPSYLPTSRGLNLRRIPSAQRSTPGTRYPTPLCEDSLRSQNVGMSDASNDTTPPLQSSQMATDRARTKKWAPKTFNGCLTCKKRRIKCDEGKPACQRCSRSNLQCAGYAPPKIKLFEPTSSSSQSPVPTTSPTPSIPATAPVCLPPTSVPMAATLASDSMPIRVASYEFDLPSGAQDSLSRPFQPTITFGSHTAPTSAFSTLEEIGAFQYYLDRTVPLLASYSHPFLWRNLLPELSRQYSPVKHCLLALSLMHQCLISNVGNSRRPSLQSNVSSGSSSSDSPATQFITQYNSAIRSLITAAPPTHIVLVSCLVFWALETFNTRPVTESGSSPTAASFSHVRAAIRILGEWKARRGPDDPHVNIITRYIEPMIRHSVWFATRDVVEELQAQLGHLALRPQDYRIISLTAEPFQDLSEARNYLRDIMRNIFTIRLQMGEPAAQDQIQALDARIGKWLCLFQSIVTTGSAAQRRTLIMYHISALLLITDLVRGMSDEDEVIVSAERRGFIMGEVEDMLDTDMDGLREICQDSECFCPVSPLSMIALAAPDMDERRRAIDILRRIESLQIDWPAGVAAQVADTCLEFSELWGVECTAVNTDNIRITVQESTHEIELGWRPQVPGVVEMVRRVSIPVEVDLTTENIPILIRTFMYRFDERRPSFA